MLHLFLNEIDLSQAHNINTQKTRILSQWEVRYYIHYNFVVVSANKE